MGHTVSLNVPQTKPLKPPSQPPRTGLHAAHVLSALVGSFLALVVYSLLAGPIAYENIDPRSMPGIDSLRLSDLRSAPVSLGQFAIQGVLENPSTRTFVSVRIIVLLRDANQNVKQTLPVTLYNILPASRRVFAVHTQRDDIRSVEARVEDAQ